MALGQSSRTCADKDDRGSQQLHMLHFPLQKVATRTALLFTQVNSLECAPKTCWIPLPTMRGMRAECLDPRSSEEAKFGCLATTR
jgi:hypothetical protein